MADLYKVEVLYGNTVVTSGEVYFAGTPKSESFSVRFNELPQSEDVVDAEAAVPVVEPPVEALSGAVLEATTEIQLDYGRGNRRGRRSEFNETDES